MKDIKEIMKNSLSDMNQIGGIDDQDLFVSESLMLLIEQTDDKLLQKLYEEVQKRFK